MSKIAAGEKMVRDLGTSIGVNAANLAMAAEEDDWVGVGDTGVELGKDASAVFGGAAALRAAVRQGFGGMSNNAQRVQASPRQNEQDGFVVEPGEGLEPNVAVAQHDVSRRHVGDSLSDRVFARYQQSLDAAYDDFHRLEAQGLLIIPQGVKRRTYMGQFIDSAARADLKDYAAVNGIEDLLDINRRLYDPESDRYRIPDLRITSASQIFDASLAPKNHRTPQVVDFHEFTGGDRITIVRPTQEGGSYSIVYY